MITEHNHATYTVEEVSRVLNKSPQAIHAHVVSGRLNKQPNSDRRHSLYGYRLDKKAVHALYGVQNHVELLLLNPKNYHQAKIEGLL
jgi:hypothetical protein